jgi:hypothetical protein
MLETNVSPPTRRRLGADARVVVRHATAVLALGAALAVAGSAFGQAGSLGQPELGSAAKMQSLRTGSTAERGLKSGEFVLVPSIQLDLHHDTNVFNGNEDETNNKPLSGTSLRLAPRLGLSNGADSDIQFNFDATGDARVYMSDNEALSNLSNFGGFADLGVTFFQRRAISLTLSENFRRTLQANNWETTQTLNRLANAVGARIAFHPGDVPERRPLEIGLGASYALDRFDEFEAGNTTTLRTRLNGSWRFLPMTAVLLDARWDFRDYETPSANSELNLTANSRPWRLQAGLAGAITQTLSIRATGGWGMSLHDTKVEEATFSGFLADVGLLFRPSAATILSLGYTRDFQDSFLGNFYSFHQGVFSLQQAFGASVTATAWMSAAYATFGALTGKGAQLSLPVSLQRVRTDIQLRGGLRMAIDVSRAFGVGIGYTLRGIVSDFKITASGAQQGQVLDASAYTAHELFAGVSVRY